MPQTVFNAPFFILSIFIESGEVMDIKVISHLKAENCL